MLLQQRGTAGASSRCRSAPIMSMIWRRRATRSASSRVASSGRGRSSGLVACGEVGDHGGIDRVGLGALAERLGEVAHLRRIDDHDAAGRRRPERAAATVSKPPVASTATSIGRERPQPLASAPPGPCRRAPTAKRAAARPDMHVQPILRDVDADDRIMSISSRPCLIGLRLRPKRLFGFDGTTGGAPSSHCGLEAQGDTVSRPPPRQASCLKSADESYKGDHAKRGGGGNHERGGRGGPWLRLEPSGERRPRPAPSTAFGGPPPPLRG